jgi:hypothetical protein
MQGCKDIGDITDTNDLIGALLIPDMAKKLSSSSKAASIAMAKQLPSSSKLSGYRTSVQQSMSDLSAFADNQADVSTEDEDSQDDSERDFLLGRYSRQRDDPGLFEQHSFDFPMSCSTKDEVFGVTASISRSEDEEMHDISVEEAETIKRKQEALTRWRAR